MKKILLVVAIGGLFVFYHLAVFMVYKNFLGIDKVNARAYELFEYNEEQIKHSTDFNVRTFNRLNMLAHQLGWEFNLCFRDEEKLQPFGTNEANRKYIQDC